MSDVGDLAGLADEAAHTHAVVIGGGIAGLVSAWEFAKVGIRVTVLEQESRPGGALRSGELAGVRLDLGAESYATRGGHVDELIAALGAKLETTAPDHRAGGAWVAGVPGVGAAKLPTGGVLGIPANPFAEDVRAVIGWKGAWRAYVDRLRPPLTIGHEASLGNLVRRRMGGTVVDRLVAPVTVGVYSAQPELIDPDVAAPGLNAALTRTGSLSGAVQYLASNRTSAPGGAVRSIAGGMGLLVDALLKQLETLGAEVVTEVAVSGLERSASVAGRSDDGPSWQVVTDRTGDDGQPVVLAADVVMLAVGGDAANGLLENVLPAVAEITREPAPAVDIVTLVLDDARLDAAPRGTGVLTVPGSHVAKALTHVTAKWPWVRESLPAGCHVLRVSFGAQGESPTTRSLSRDKAIALALAEAGNLMGLTFDPSTVVDADVQSFDTAQPASVLGQRETTDRLRSSIRAVPGLGAVGAWLAGTGLAQVVPDAIIETERIRRFALFGTAAAGPQRGEP